MSELREALSPHRRSGAVVGLVPTMGSLHEGHLTLIDRAGELSDVVVSSIFVNPLQFGEGEDLELYPRELERDLELCRERGVDVVFAPSVEEMYPGGAPSVTLSAGALGERLCGAYRPGHFDGVLTVVAKLFHLVSPQLAVFGRKDFQQAVLIRRMVDELDFPVRIEVGPIVRESDGLALSSRNRYLSPAERDEAARIHEGLRRALDAFGSGERRAAFLGREVRDALEGAANVGIQYIEVVDPESLSPIEEARPGVVVAIAAFVGGTRLIDNETLS